MAESVSAGFAGWAIDRVRLARLADLLEEEVVLRVARANLEDVREFVHRLDVGRRHHFRDDRHTRLLTGGRQDLQAAPAQHRPLV